MQGFKKHLEEKLKASDDMGTWVKDFQDSDAPQFKGKSQKKRQQMAVAAKLSAERNEEVELDEKAYVSSLSPEMGRKGSHDVIGKDGKVVKSYPYTKDGMKAAQAHLSKMKEEVELGESNLTSDDLHRIAKDHDNAAKKHGTAYDQTRSTAAARNHEIAWNRHVDAAKAHREAAKDKSKHSHEKLEKMSNHAWDATDHIRKHFDESVELDEVSDLQKAFISSMQSKLKKRSSLRDPNAKTAREEDKLAKQLAAKAKMKKEEVELEEGPIKAIGTAFKKHRLDKEIRKTRADREQMIRQSKTNNYQDYAKEYEKSLAKSDDLKKQLKSISKKEEVELDEAAPKLKGDWLKKEREKNREHDAAMGRTPTGRKKPVRQMTSTQRSLASMRKEEVELDEQTQYDLVEAYLLENNIDVDTLSVEQLDEIIGKVIGGAFKVGAKAAVGAARLAKKAVVNKQGNVRGTAAAKNDAMKAKLDKLRKQRAVEVQRQKLKKDVERAQSKLAATKSRAN